MGKKVELDIGLDIDTMSVDQLTDALEKVKKQSEDISSIDLKGSQQSLENLQKQVQLFDQLIAKKKTFIQEQALSTYKAGVLPEARGQMAAGIFKQFREAGLATPEEQEVEAMVREQIAGQRVGVREERQRLSEMQAQRANVAEQMKQVQSGQGAQGGGGGALGISTAAMGRGALGVGMGLLGAGTLAATMIQAVRWGSEYEAILKRISAAGEKVGSDTFQWAKNVGLARREGAGLAMEMGRAATGRVRGMGGFVETGFGFGFQPDEMTQFAQMIRFGGVDTTNQMHGLLMSGKRHAAGMGRPTDMFALAAGTAMATDVLGRTLTTVSSRGAQGTIQLLQKTFGNALDPQRATRMAMGFQGAFQTEDEPTLAFLLRSMDFQGGDIGTYYRARTQLEQGISDPRLMGRVMERAAIETGNDPFRMAMMLRGLNKQLGYGQAETMARRYLMGESFTDEQIKEQWRAPSAKEETAFRGVWDEKKKAWVGGDKRRLTGLEEAMAAFKDFIESQGLELSKRMLPFFKGLTTGIKIVDNFFDGIKKAGKEAKDLATALDNVAERIQGERGKGMADIFRGGGDIYGSPYMVRAQQIARIRRITTEKFGGTYREQYKAAQEEKNNAIRQLLRTATSPLGERMFSEEDIEQYIETEVLPTQGLLEWREARDIPKPMRGRDVGDFPQIGTEGRVIGGARLLTAARRARIKARMGELGYDVPTGERQTLIYVTPKQTVMIQVPENSIAEAQLMFKEFMKDQKLSAFEKGFLKDVLGAGEPIKIL